MINSDYEWFKSNIKALYKEYGDNYISIKNCSVLGVYSTYAEAVEKTSQTEEVGTFIVQKCGKDSSAYTNYISSICFCC